MFKLAKVVENDVRRSAAARMLQFTTHLEQVLLVAQGLLLLVPEFSQGIVEAIVVNQLRTKVP